MDTIKHIHLKYRFWWLLTNIFTLLVSTTSKMQTITMTTDDFLVHYPSQPPPPLFPGNHWPAFHLHRLDWPSLEFNIDVKMGLVSSAQHDVLRFIHDLSISDSVLSPFSSGSSWHRYHLLSICLFTDIYIFSGFVLIWIKLSWTFIDKSFCGHMLIFHMVKSPGLGSLNHTASACLIL